MQYLGQIHEPAAVPRECSTEARHTSQRLYPQNAVSRAGTRASSCTQRLQYQGQTHEPSAVPRDCSTEARHTSQLLYPEESEELCTCPSLQLQGNTGNLYCYHIKLCVGYCQLLNCFLYTARKVLAYCYRVKLYEGYNQHLNRFSYRAKMFYCYSVKLCVYYQLNSQPFVVQ